MEFVLYLYHVEIVYKDREICKIVRVWLSFLPPLAHWKFSLGLGLSGV